jgi:hypothetical protein
MSAHNLEKEIPRKKGYAKRAKIHKKKKENGVDDEENAFMESINNMSNEEDYELADIYKDDELSIYSDDM